MLMSDTKTQNEIFQHMMQILLVDKSPLEQKSFIKNSTNYIIDEKFKRTQFPKMNIEIKHQ